MTNIIINKSTCFVEQKLRWVDGRKVNESDYEEYIIVYDETDNLIDDINYKYNTTNKSFEKHQSVINQGETPEETIAKLTAGLAQEKINSMKNQKLIQQTISNLANVKLQLMKITTNKTI